MLKFKGIGDGWKNWEQRHLFQSWFTGIVGRNKIEIGILSIIGIVQTYFPSAFPIFLLFMKLNSNIHAMIWTHSVLISQAIFSYGLPWQSEWKVGICWIIWHSEEAWFWKSDCISRSVNPGSRHGNCIRKSVGSNQWYIMSSIITRINFWPRFSSSNCKKVQERV